MNKTIAVFLRHSSKWDPNKPVREQAYWDEHALFMDALFEAGTIVLAGPFADDSGTMIILNAENEEAARAILREDPWAQRDVLVIDETKEWTIFLDARDRPSG